jgi:hypothetical protein
VPACLSFCILPAHNVDRLVEIWNSLSLSLSNSRTRITLRTERTRLNSSQSLDHLNSRTFEFVNPRSLLLSSLSPILSPACSLLLSPGLSLSLPPISLQPLCNLLFLQLPLPPTHVLASRHRCSVGIAQCIHVPSASFVNTHTHAHSLTHSLTYSLTHSHPLTPAHSHPP